MNKKITPLIVLFVGIIIGFFFYSKKAHIITNIFEELKFNLSKEEILVKNQKIEENLKKGIYKFNNKNYSYKEFSLEESGFKFSKDLDAKPIGYLDVHNNRIILVAYDGTIYSSNKIEEIKNGKLILNKISEPDSNLRIDPNDEMSYRNIKIRDILINNDTVYIVSNRSQLKDDGNYYGSIEVLKGEIKYDKEKIKLSKFFYTDEEFYKFDDWSHTGGRLINIENGNFLLSVADFKLEYPELVEKVSSNQSIAGKTILINEDNHEVFSKGHRNIQGLFYDKNNQVIFSSEHGPTGGDEINIISRGENYGWPKSSYGTLGYEFEGHPRKHKKYGFKEPLYYWWPYNCAPSEITMVNKDFNSNWNNSILVSCLSGNHLNGQSLVRFAFDKKNFQLSRKEQFYIGDRIRDLKYLEKNKVLILLLESKKSLALIFE